MLAHLLPKAAVLRRFHNGPLGCHIDGFVAHLLSRGYKTSTTKNKVRVVAGLNQWLDRRGFGVRDFDEQQVQAFLRSSRRSAEGEPAVTLRQLLEYFRAQGVIPPPAAQVSDSPLARLERDFKRYLSEERALAQSTAVHPILWMRRFLAESFGTKRIDFKELDAQTITRFVLRHAQPLSSWGAVGMVASLRHFLGFLYLRGAIVNDLAACVPSVAHWRLSTVPRFLSREQVEHLLKSCDQSTATGQRNYAILLLLARLGLRAGEVVAMELEDIDWECGELTVRGKGLRRDRLPLPHDVGKALARYLRHGRPCCSTRRVFVRRRAPHEGFALSTTIRSIVCRTLARAGLNPPHKGAHLLRHSLATDMLRKGASLSQIGEVLRHQRLNTTQIYAKVDLVALRKLAQPWPGGDA